MDVEGYAVRAGLSTTFLMVVDFLAPGRFNHGRKAFTFFLFIAFYFFLIFVKILRIVNKKSIIKT